MMLSMIEKRGFLAAASRFPWRRPPNVIFFFSLSSAAALESQPAKPSQAEPGAAQSGVLPLLPLLPARIMLSAGRGTGRVRVHRGPVTGAAGCRLRRAVTDGAGPPVGAGAPAARRARERVCRTSAAARPRGRPPPARSAGEAPEREGGRVLPAARWKQPKPSAGHVGVMSCAPAHAPHARTRAVRGAVADPGRLRPRAGWARA